MKKSKKRVLTLICLAVIVFAIAIFCVVYFSRGKEGEIFSAENEFGQDGSNQQDDGKEENEEPESGEEAESNKEQVKEEIILESENILLANNGIGYKIDFFENGESNFEIENEEVATLLTYFDSAIIISPKKVGETNLKIKIETDKEIKVKNYKIFIMPYDENLSIMIDGYEEGKALFGGQKADGMFDFYNVSVTSCRNLTINDFSIEKSDNINIVENSYNLESGIEGGTILSFSFYIDGGSEGFIKASVENNFLNFNKPSTGEKNFSVKSYVKEIEYSISNGKNLPLTTENGYLLYLPNENYIGQMNEQGYYTYYDLKIDTTIFSVTALSQNIDLKESTSGYIISAKSEGEGKLGIVAKDGSMQSLEVLFKVERVKPKSYTLKIQEQEITYSNLGFYSLLKNLGEKTIKLEEGNFVVELYLDPIFGENNFSINNLSGSCVDLTVEEQNGKIILTFKPVEAGQTTFEIFENESKISSFSFNVEQEEIYEERDIIEFVTSEREAYFKVALESEMEQKIEFTITSESSDVECDKVSYNGKIFIRFNQPGIYYFVAENLEYGIFRTVKIIVE